MLLLPSSTMNKSAAFEVILRLSVMCYKCSAVAEMGDRLATIDIGRKLGPQFLAHVYCTRPTQPSTLSMAENKYRPKCGDPSSHFATTDIIKLLINYWTTFCHLWQTTMSLPISSMLFLRTDLHGASIRKCVTTLWTQIVVPNTGARVPVHLSCVSMVEI